MKTLIKFILVGLFALCLSPLVCHAQEAAPVGPDIAAAKVYGVPVAAILSLVTTFVVAGIKWTSDKLLGKIPPAVIPLVALAVSYGLDWLSHFTFGTDSNGLIALGAGLAAVGLNQLKKQLVPAPSAPVSL